jgi:hypothetical protein
MAKTKLKWNAAQVEDAGIIEDLKTRNTSEADCKIDIVLSRMARRQVHAADRGVKLSPQVCSCGAIAGELVSIYWLCDKCVTDQVSNEEFAFSS